MISIILFVAVLGVLAGVVLYPWLKDRRSQGWPLAEAEIKSGKVYDSYGTPHPQFTVEVSYSFEAAGNSYQGIFELVVPAADAAENLRKQWVGTTVPVRYNPKRPSQSELDPFRNELRKS